MSRYLFDEMAIERDIVCLLSIINASGRNHKLLSKYPPCIDIFYTEWTLIQELLISTAIKLRLIDDLFKDTGENNSNPTDDVGVLVKNCSAKPQKLSLRGACNKIIHAKEFLPTSKVAAIIDEFEDREYLPSIKLTGEKDGAVWSATIDLEKYCAYALVVLDNYAGSDIRLRTGNLE